MVQKELTKTKEFAYMQKVSNLFIQQLKLKFLWMPVHLKVIFGQTKRNPPVNYIYFTIFTSL